jgi:saccharopine dehydrogenase (NAD+, L-glutamate forming)
MPDATDARKPRLDLVLFGATGFTGRLTAQYLASHAPADLRWALAGRSQPKLAAVRDTLAAINPACAGLPLLSADVTDPASLRALAAGSRVVVTTVGPFLRYGEPLVAACAQAGTDYLDICGEPEFVDLMYLRHHERAVRTGARIVHACGFDSVPTDLGAYFTVQQLPPDVPLRVDGYLQAGGRFSGGTYQTVLTALARRRETARAARERRQAEPRPAERRVRVVPGKPGRIPELDRWVLPLPTLDPLVVRRSAAALPRYGPDFRYRHYLALKHLPAAVAGALGFVGLAGLVQLPPVRGWLARRYPAGRGPSAEQRANGWFRVRFIGEGGGRRVVTEVTGGDPGYDEAAKMLAESGLSLAFDELPRTAGQVTTAVAMGDALIDRLARAGISFRVLS